MAVTVPTSLTRPTALERFAPVRASQLGAIVEADAFVRSRLRPLASIGGEDTTTTSLTYVTVTQDRPVRASPNNSGSLDIHHYGSNITCRVQVTDGTTTVTSVQTIAGGPSLSSGTLNVSSLSGTSWRMSLSILVPATGTATHTGTLVEETTHTASTIA